MGSGKTTLGRALHGAIGPDGVRLRFVDLDEAVEQAEGATVAKIFSRKEEAYFRRLESDTLRRLTATPGTVVACGGGTPCQPGNMEWMNSNGLTILLQASDEALLRRLSEGAAKRPLIASLSCEELRAFIASKQAERQPFYSQAALTFPSDLLETADEITASRQRFLQLIECHMI